MGLFGFGDRAKNEGLNAGGANSSKSKKDPTVTLGQSTDTGLMPADNDWRVKITLPKAANYFYNMDRAVGVLTPLYNYDGFVFPYTPQIQVTHAARYSEQALVHSNYKQYFYEGSDVQPITITGEFTVQSKDDADYLLAGIYFFRALTKMFFGEGELAGNPPPLVYLNGYGKYYLPNISCVVTNFSHTMPAEVDYFLDNVDAGSDANWVPTLSTLNVTLQPVVSRSRIAGLNGSDAFNLQRFVEGEYIGDQPGGGLL